MPRLLLLATTTGYQVRSFDDAARRLGLELVLATDRCHVLDDPWRDRAIPIRFHPHQEAEAVEAIGRVAETRSFDGVLGVGDRPAVIAALVAEALSLPFSPPAAVRAAGNKLLTRVRFRDAGLPTPWFIPVTRHRPPNPRVTFPCVVKPMALSASRGVMRANTPAELDRAVARACGVVDSWSPGAPGDGATQVLVEGYLPGREVAVEGVVERGQLRTFAIFDKPTPLEGPFFEETIYVTPSNLSARDRAEVTRAVARAAAALGLTDGPVHGECRINDDGVFVLELAARPIGGLCARALRFRGPTDDPVSLEEVLLRHAMGQSIAHYRREERAAGVMMIPIPRGGRYKRVGGLAEATAVSGVVDITMTAKRDQRLRPLPEGGSYLGFIFARAPQAGDVVAALREAHERLTFDIEPEIPVVGAAGGQRRA